MIYKLKYNTRDEGIKDLKSKGVYNGTAEAIVEVGLCIEKEAIYDTDGEMVEQPVYKDCYCFDVMTNEVIEFSNQVYPEKAAHKFAGHE